MVEWFFFDWLGCQAGGVAVAEGDKLIASVLPDETEAGLSIFHLAVSRAECAEQAALLIGAPPFSNRVSFDLIHRLYLEPPQRVGINFAISPLA